MANLGYNLDLLQALMSSLNYTPEQRQFIINSLVQKDPSYLNGILQANGAKAAKKGTFGF